MLHFESRRVFVHAITMIGAFSVSGLSIYLGYDLFLRGAAGEFEFTAAYAGGEVTLWSVAPGIGFALFGAFVAIFAIARVRDR